jgi:large conductance mechanosensitive channel
VLQGFKDFLARGNIVDLAVAVVIGTAFTGLVTKFTDSIIQPLINRIGAGTDASYGILKIEIGGGQAIDLNVLLSAAINFALVAAVVYFLVVLPYNKIRTKEAAESATDKQTRLLTEIRDALGGTDSKAPVARAKDFTLDK